MVEKPKNIEEYKKWLKEQHGVTITDRTERYYETVVNKIKRDFEQSEFWIGIIENLRQYEEEYTIDTGYALFTPNFEPKLEIKPFKSFLLKTFRKNIIENELYPNEPTDSWILPKNWFSRVNDILRTLFVVKYLDGVDYMIRKVNSLCEQSKTEFKCFLEAREEGYYAAHLYARQKFEIPQETWDTAIVDFSIELQITTQLQEVIRRLLHKYYEEKRGRAKENGLKWQWNYRSDEFIANYLGHILHYVEGMIVDIRERQKKEEA
jgi:hypothetical protein